MYSAFISYSTKDEEIAQTLKTTSELAGIRTFLASISIEGGEDGTETIFESLKESNWVFFLASKNSVASPFVLQELGASLFHEKTIIPLLIDIEPEDLPGWVKKHQAINLRDSPELLQKAIDKIADKIKVDKFWAGVIVGVIMAVLMYCLFKKK
jgi:hypothetical protein